MTSAKNLIHEKTDVFGNTAEYVEVIDPFKGVITTVPASDDDKLRLFTCGSDRITVINGSNSHRGVYDDFNKAMDIYEKGFSNPNILNMGLLAEDTFRKRTEQMWEYLGLHKGSKVVQGKTLYRHGKNVTFRASPDGIIEDDPSVVFEYKVRWWSDEELYGERLTDQVRESEKDQCQWHMFLSGATTCFLGVWFHPKSDIEWFKIVRDDNHIDRLVKKAEAYFASHIATGTPPPADESDGCKAYYQRQEEREGTRRPFETDEWAWAIEHHEIKQRMAVDKARKQELENYMRESMGEIQELYVEGGKSKATCKKPKNSETRTLRITVKD
jgi:hypothetical protein